MSRDYHFDRDAYNPYEQDYDSGFSSQNREYRDLYNPYKSTWERALKEKTQTQTERGSHSYSKNDEPSGYGQRGKSSVGKDHHQASTFTRNQNNAKSALNDEVVYNSGVDVTKKNTYNYRTTGYGPRD